MPLPFVDAPFTFTQPDGTLLAVRGTGNQHHAVFETLDGFTVTRNPMTGFYQYAQLEASGHALVATGLTPGVAQPFGLQPNLRLAGPAAKVAALGSTGLPATRSRWQVRRDEARVQVQVRAATEAFGLAPAPPQHRTEGDYVGLCLLIQFPDVEAQFTPAQVERFCNQVGYQEFGNNGSVHDYFLDVSAGKLRYTNVVAPVYTAKRKRSYYTDEKIPWTKRTRELILEALGSLKASGFDLSRLSTDDKGYVYALNVFYAGRTVNNWSQGLWPHSSNLMIKFKLGQERYYSGT